ncbi:MAG: Maf family protein, partial [Spirochaetales bacterium]|nr:Maf family protein [Spirochaetales bacterium]
MLVKPVIEPSLILKAQELFPKVILASQSENRRKLLEDMNISVIQKPQCINELCGLTEPVEVVTTLSKQKLDSYLNS